MRLPQLGPNYYAPTVLGDVTQEMRIMREETFGPVLPIMACAGDEDAVRMANDSEFGFGSQRLDSRWEAGRASGAAHSCRYGNGQRRHFVFWHQRGSARWSEGERCGTHPWTVRAR